MPALRTNEEFLEVVRKSGVVEADRLEEYLRQQAAVKPLPTEPQALAAMMVRDGLLTVFQANQLIMGRWKRFILMGKYKLLETLGAGGMGKVFLCEHIHLRRLVALKVLPRDAVGDGSAVERFYREARAVAALDHPNIVRAHDVDQEDQLHFLVMEYVDGASLQYIVKTHGPLEVPQACHYITQAAHGLQHAHEAGWVHRDIKPGNILLDRSGVIKVLDMGLARLFHDDKDTITQRFDDKSVLGTADYVAPEQAVNSHNVDIRADIYSLGATFYFCLTGRAPFEEGTVAQKLIWHQMRAPTPIQEFRSDVPEGLIAVIETMMAKDRDRRYATPSEVIDALAPFTPSTLPPPPPELFPKHSPAVARLCSGEVGPASPNVRRRVPALAGAVAGSASAEAPSPPASSGSSLPRRSNPSLKLPISSLRNDDTIRPVSSRRFQPSLTPPTTASQVTESPPRKQRWPMILAGTAVVLVLAAVGGGYVIWSQRTPATQPGNNTVAPPEVRLPALSGSDKVVSRSPLPELQSQGRVFATVLQALQQCRPGDRIVVADDSVEEQLALADGKLGRGVTIEGWGPSGSVIWRTPPNFDKGRPLVDVANVDGLVLKNFTFDGDDERAEVLVTVSGACPGLRLENLVLRQYKSTGIVLHGVTGTADRPVVLSQLRITTGKKKQRESALRIGPPLGPDAAGASQHIAVVDCRFEGLHQAAVVLEGSLLDVAFQRNRLYTMKSSEYRLGPAFLYRPAATPSPLRITISSNTFLRFADGLRLAGLPPTDGSSHIEFRNNLFIGTTAIVSADVPAPEERVRPLFPLFEGNVTRPNTGERGLPYLLAMPMDFDYLSENTENDATFLRYSRQSMLARLGPGNTPVGAPPPVDGR
ncbi:MAG: serine/threonine protein kinase [Gemmataceae bacterium]|nr:serine/threonine protein kinase [Gemmataceae bacterium]MDW8267063.1 serine/threonine-protein kinase [Gemmataceae bacterium]